MSADLLRRAASLMRERAEGAGLAWGADPWTAGEVGYDDRQGLTHDVHAGGALVAATGCEELAEHIASWHPAVALAVSDLLDAAAHQWIPDPHGADETCCCCPHQRQSVDLARAYLGEQA